MSLFEIISEIEDVEIIAVGSKIRDIEWLRKTYGIGRWRKLKGFARIRFLDSEECDAELPPLVRGSRHRQREMKVKDIFD